MGGISDQFQTNPLFCSVWRHLFSGEIMPEARDRFAGVGAEDLELGFGTQRPGFSAGLRPRVLYPFQSENKENMVPDFSRSRRRRTRQKKSPLPSWYPRTPLRDITHIVNVNPPLALFVLIPLQFHFLLCWRCPRKWIMGFSWIFNWCPLFIFFFFFLMCICVLFVIIFLGLFIFPRSFFV